MYAWLSLDLVNGDVTACVIPCPVNPLDPPEANPDKLRQRRGTVMQTLRGLRPPLRADESNRLYAALSALVECLPADHSEVEFAVCMGLAHHRLPLAHRDAREQVIDTIINSYFGPPAVRPQRLQYRLELIRTQMRVLPDGLLEGHVRSACAGLLMQTIMSTSPVTADPQARKDFDLLRNAATAAARTPGEPAAIFEALRKAYAVTPTTQRPSFIGFVAAPANRAAVAVAAQVHAAFLDRLPLCAIALRMDALVEVLREVASSPGSGLGRLAIDDTVQARIVDLQSQQERTYNRIRLETMAALDAGVPMGQKGEITRHVLGQLRRAEQQLSTRLAPTRARQAKVRPPAGEMPPDSTDMAPMHAWSVARLVRWIEGPLAERSRSGRLDRQAVVAREKTAFEQAATVERPAVDESPGAGAFTEDEVGLAMHEALGATARFFHDDIADMAPLASSLGTDPLLIARCLDLQSSLQSLVGSPDEIDEEKARALLQDAEDRTGELRKGIRAAEASAQLVGRFRARLVAALKAETLVLGKRHGGVIACPLHTTDWAWVAQMYHRCWLPQVTRLMIDGDLITLAADQAVAWYVTGSSHSGHAFDVSVHLWQRRAGGTGMPSERLDDCPPMNEAEWFDTYIPCAVLHVPQAQ